MDLRVFGEKFSIIFEKVANVDFIVVLPGLDVSVVNLSLILVALRAESPHACI